MLLPRRLLNWFGSARPGRSGHPTAPIAERPDWWSRVSIHETTLLRCPLEEEVALLQRAGVPGIGLCQQKLKDLPTIDIVSELSDAPLKVSSLGTAGGFTNYNGFSHRDAIQEGLDLIELAEAVQAPVLRVISGPTAGHLRKQARRLLLDGVRELLPLARACGVRLALQPMSPVYHEWSFLNSLDAAMSVIQEIDSPFLGLALGTCHLGQEKQVLKRLPALVPSIFSVQLSDWVPTISDADRRLPGQGRLPLSEIVTTIESHGYRGWYELEVWSRDLWKRDPETLMAECLQSLDCLIPSSTAVVDVG